MSERSLTGRSSSSRLGPSTGPSRSRLQLERLNKTKSKDAGTDAEAGGIFCSQQIRIPEALPEIMKQFSKSAIRTQPPDLLPWATAYFYAMAKGERPPVKDRIEYPTIRNSASQLTPGLLKIMHRQLGHLVEVDEEDLGVKWTNLGLDKKEMISLMQAGGLAHKFSWCRFAALSAASMSKDLNDTMVVLCEVMTKYPTGGPANIPLHLFLDMYIFLSSLDPEATKDRTQSCVKFLEDLATKNELMICPTDLDHEDCPRLT